MLLADLTPLLLGAAAETAAMEILRVVLLGPITVLLAIYTLKVAKDLRASELARVQEVKESELKRVSDLQASQKKMEELIDRFYKLMVDQGEALSSIGETIRDQTREFAELRGKLGELRDKLLEKGGK
jgi:hypothetical protein